MRLLLSGFEPFGGERLNPSAEILRALAAAPPDGVELETLLLPVRAGGGFDRLWPRFAEGGFDAWLGLGQAGGRAGLCVERVAVNLLQVPGEPDRAVAPGGPDAYFARLPVDALAAALRALAPAQVSNSAGLFHCNELLYSMRHRLVASGRDRPSGFLHLPYLPEQLAGKPEATSTLPLDTQLAAVRRAVLFVRDLPAPERYGV